MSHKVFLKLIGRSLGGTKPKARTKKPRAQRRIIRRALKHTVNGKLATLRIIDTAGKLIGKDLDRRKPHQKQKNKLDTKIITSGLKCFLPLCLLPQKI